MTSARFTRRVMIVDDNEIMAEMLSLVVTAQGLEILVAHSGSRALDLIAEAKPDLILLDLMMPEMDGFETLRHIRAMPIGHDIPVIVVTAREEADLEEQVIRAGGKGYIPKPVDTAALMRLLRTHLGSAEPRRELQGHV